MHVKRPRLCIPKPPAYSRWSFTPTVEHEAQALACLRACPCSVNRDRLSVHRDSAGKSALVE